MANPTSQLRRPASGDDLLLQCLSGFVSPRSSVLDVGAGPGRYAVPLAARAGAVTAVEPDATMAGLLKSAVSEAGLTNVKIVQAAWQDADVPPAEVVICAHVLYPIAAADAFVAKLDAHARAACFLALRATTPEVTPLGKLWQRFHGQPRLLQPGYAEMFDLLYEIGIHASVRVQPGPGQSWAYESVEQAVDAVREHLIVPATPDNDAEIRRELERALVHEDQVWRLPAPPTYLAVIWWDKYSTVQENAPSPVGGSS